MNYCEDCGCEVYNGHCVNCHEELYIMDQYYEMVNDELKHSLSDEFVEKVKQQRDEIKRKKTTS